MPRIKLSEDDVQHLLKVAATGLVKQYDIAIDFGVSKSYVSRLVNRKYKRKIKAEESPAKSARGLA